MPEDPAALPQTGGNLTSASLPQDPVDVLYALSGDDPDFLLEFENSLKSVLLNAPLDAALRIHILCDEVAHKGLSEVFNRTEITEIRARNPTFIKVYNCQYLLKKWRARLRSMMMPISGAESRHTIGTFFRLFADYMLPDYVHHFIYLDTDVIILANLAEVWSLINPKAYFQWGDSQCAGFVIFKRKSLRKMWHFWATGGVMKLNQLNMQNSVSIGYDDQSLLRVFHNHTPEKVDALPPRWDIHYANGLWKFTNRLVSVREQAGMLHFNGHSQASLLKDDREAVVSTWGLANFHINLPWPWAKFIIESTINKAQGDGYPLHLDYVLWSESQFDKFSVFDSTY